MSHTFSFAARIYALAAVWFGIMLLSAATIVAVASGFLANQGVAPIGIALVAMASAIGIATLVTAALYNRVLRGRPWRLRDLREAASIGRGPLPAQLIEASAGEASE